MKLDNRIKTGLRWVHRWMALTLGVILTIVSLSGSLLLFQDHFFRWAHCELVPAKLSQEVKSLDQWVANADKAVGAGAHGPIAFWPPRYDHNLSDAGMLMYESGREAGGFSNLAYTA
ncbi:MAG: PepSY domain-containing protein, partial [Steroidobacteraceae bacterium]